MPIQIIEGRRLYRQIAAQLSALIASGEFKAGERLPPERELARLLGVSRPSVREALICLEVEGKVDVRVGAGIFVSERPPMPEATLSDEGQGPFELLRARWLIEGEVAARAARERTASHLAIIRSAVDDMRKSQQKGENDDPADRAFHLGIAAATHNGALITVVERLWDRGRGELWKRMEHHFLTPALHGAVLEDHRAIYAALEAGDARQARLAMHKHLGRVDREFTRGWRLLQQRGNRSTSGWPEDDGPAPPARPSTSKGEPR
jgi:DNA-binding FadR family transcriptional regulator